MSVLMPCNACTRRPECEIRAVKRNALRGLNLVSVRFNCPIFEGDFRPGRRVMATITAGYVDAGDGYGPQYADAIVPATIIGNYNRATKRVLIWPDEEHHEALDNMKHEKRFAKLSPAKIAFLDEPDRPERVAEFEAWKATRDALAAQSHD